jgi:hypothetical protein
MATWEEYLESIRFVYQYFETPGVVLELTWDHRVQRGKCGQPVCPVASSIAGYAGCHLPANPL